MPDILNGINDQQLKIIARSPANVSIQTDRFSEERYWMGFDSLNLYFILDNLIAGLE